MHPANKGRHRTILEELPRLLQTMRRKSSWCMRSCVQQAMQWWISVQVNAEVEVFLSREIYWLWQPAD
ncbi:hypothetical protein ANCCEY_04080 [Ancylostoma ceylanicum]|uniref:Uncharacterized protein n=1 Tax=Ancylostoma ceylanicum TaxID=53326 RepID=A0A0D6M025_9BILA|nr:hypothetical protein ANCCEY_04080 [Ancylostoma ceylanicum]